MELALEQKLWGSPGEALSSSRGGGGEGSSAEEIAVQGSTGRINFPARMVKLKIPPVGSMSGFLQEISAKNKNKTKKTKQTQNQPHFINF